MGIENITARILAEAQEEAGKMRSAAQAEREKILSKAKEEAESQKNLLEKKAVEEARLLKERKASVAELEVRKMKLAAKQEMIEEGFQKATEEIAQMDSGQYEALLERALVPFRDVGGEILLNERDQKRIGEGMKAWTAGSGLVVAQETVDIQGGFLLRRGSIYINGSLEEMLAVEKKELTAELASMLFE